MPFVISNPLIRLRNAIPRRGCRRSPSSICAGTSLITTGPIVTSRSHTARITRLTVCRPSRAIKVQTFNVEAQPARVGFVENNRGRAGIDKETKSDVINPTIDPELSIRISKIVNCLRINRIASARYKYRHKPGAQSADLVTVAVGHHGQNDDPEPYPQRAKLHRQATRRSKPSFERIGRKLTVHCRTRSRCGT